MGGTRRCAGSHHQPPATRPHQQAGRGRGTGSEGTHVLPGAGLGGASQEEGGVCARVRG